MNRFRSVSIDSSGATAASNAKPLTRGSADRASYNMVLTAAGVLLACLQTGLGLAAEPSASFAMVSDYGARPAGSGANPKCRLVGGKLNCALPVADMINSWNPEFIVTAGDNTQIDAKKGPNKKEREDYLLTAHKLYGPGAKRYGLADFIKRKRFFPAIGNHDANKTDGDFTVYEKYFDKNPGRLSKSRGIICASKKGKNGCEYYRKVVKDGSTRILEVFVLNSDPLQHGDDASLGFCTSHPDSKFTCLYEQKIWLEAALKTSRAKWQLVVLHHAPFSSGKVHKSYPLVQWDFEQWGADAVVSGHNHFYERLHTDDTRNGNADLRYGGIPYLEIGNGGFKLYGFRGGCSPGKGRDAGCEKGSTVRFKNFGALYAQAVGSELPSAGVEPTRNSPWSLRFTHVDLENADLDHPQDCTIRVETEDYVDYKDRTRGNSGDGYRFDDVDISHSGTPGVGWYVRYDRKEWLEYTVDVGVSGNHTLALRVRTRANNRKLDIYVDGKKKSRIALPKTNGKWANVNHRLGQLAAGRHTLRVQSVNGGVHADWLEIH